MTIDSQQESIRKLAVKLSMQQPTFSMGDVQKGLRKPPSRQYIQTVLKNLVGEGSLVAGGKGKAAKYAHPQNKDLVGGRFDKTFVLEDLEEHRVFDYLRRNVHFLDGLKDNVFSIYDFTIQEMLNNAIDHSRGSMVRVRTHQDENTVHFMVEDDGVGLFENIRAGFELDDEYEAVQELLKGKTTTDPKNHTGEGIFFSSKAADVFEIESHNIKLLVDNIVDDIFVIDADGSRKGTVIRAQINKKSSKHLSDVFKKYQADDDTLAFSKTTIHVKLYTKGTIYVSRSQAKRVLGGVDKKFDTIILDFNKVATIGQGFADEVFRVFLTKHPKITVHPINACPAVQFMIDRAITTAKLEKR